MTSARRSAEARRLLGLRRAPIYHMAADTSPAVRSPVAVVQAGTMPKVKAS